MTNTGFSFEASGPWDEIAGVVVDVEDLIWDQVRDAITDAVYDTVPDLLEDLPRRSPRERGLRCSGQCVQPAREDQRNRC